VDSQSASPPSDTFEIRRARWGAAGVAADQRLDRRAVIVAIMLSCCFLVAALVTFYVR
jgi:hypothetical protein